MKTQEKIESLKSNWYVWFFPVIALLVCAWLFMGYLKTRGPEIEIRFDDASSIQPEKTRVRFRGVSIGVVKNVKLTADGKDVVATVALQKDAAHFAVEGSRFWLVMPKVNFQGISGLETLVQGNYITLLPGPADGNPKYEFKGQLAPESTDSVEDTVAYYLETDVAGSVSVGDAVSFRGVSIGSVSKVSLSKTAQQVHVQINVMNKYTRLVRSNTVFWRKVGVQAKLGLFNSELKINSLDSLLRGGIDLFTPDQVGEVAKAQSRFELLAAPPKGYEKWNPKLEF